MAGAGRKEDGAVKVGRVALNNVATHSKFLVRALVFAEYDSFVQR